MNATIAVPGVRNRGEIVNILRKKKSFAEIASISVGRRNQRDVNRLGKKVLKSSADKNARHGIP